MEMQLRADNPRMGGGKPQEDAELKQKAKSEWMQENRENDPGCSPHHCGRHFSHQFFPQTLWPYYHCRAVLSAAGPDGYPRVLDYSTFDFITLPYSKNFTTRSSSRVVTISSFCPIIQIFGMGWHHSFLDNVSMMLSLDQSDSDCITHTDILDKEQLLSLFESIDQSIYKYHVP